MNRVPDKHLPPGIRSAHSLAREVMSGATACRTDYTPADLSLLDSLARTHLTRMGEVVEADVAARDGNAYRVRLDGSAWACSCPAATYGGRGAEPCKHARALRIIRATLPPSLGGVP